MGSKYELTESRFIEQFELADFILKTQAQIAKDFDRSGHDVAKILYEQTHDLDELTEIVSLMLDAVLKKGEQTTLQLLYQIDVPQGKFLQLTTDPEFLKKASLLIIRREAQKVYLRSIL